MIVIPGRANPVTPGPPPYLGRAQRSARNPYPPIAMDRSSPRKRGPADDLPPSSTITLTTSVCRWARWTTTRASDQSSTRTSPARLLRLRSPTTSRRYVARRPRRQAKLTRRFPPSRSVTTSTRSMHRAREKSGVATIVTRRLAYAPSLQNAEPLLLRAQFVEPFERRIDLLAVLGVRVHLLKPANECNIFRTQFRRQLVHSLIQLIDFLLIF